MKDNGTTLLLVLNWRRCRSLVCYAGGIRLSYHVNMPADLDRKGDGHGR